MLVENVPGNATKADEWIEFFKTLSPLDEHGGKVADVTIALNNGDIFRNKFCFIDSRLSSLIYCQDESLICIQREIKLEMRLKKPKRNFF